MTTMAPEVESDFDPNKALARAIKHMQGKASEDEQNRKYLAGEHPRLSWVAKIRKVFGDSVADQIHQANYCERVVDAPLGRMKVESFGDDTADELATANGLLLSQRDLYSDMFVIDTGYIAVTEAEEGSDAPFDIVVQRSEDCYVEMASLKPGDRKFGVKVTADPDLGEEGGYRAWVWDRTTYWRFVAETGDPEANPMPNAEKFVEDSEDPSGPHGFERVPLIPFALGREPRSRIAKVRPVQDRIDMLEVMKVVAGLFGASKQRVFFTSQEMDDDTTESSPDYAIVLDPGNKDDGTASVTEFTHTPLDNYDGAIDAEIDRLYEIAELPKHGRQNPGGQASGEAIKSEDGPFISMVGSYVEAADSAWAEVWALFDIEIEEIVWRDLETRDELSEMATVKAAVDAGMPLETALVKYAHFTEDDLKDMRKAKAAQDEAEAAAREAQMLAFEQDRPTREMPAFE